LPSWVIGGVPHPARQPQALDRGSLQLHGDYALGLARKLGDADLNQLQAPADYVYFYIPRAFPSISLLEHLAPVILAAVASGFLYLCERLVSNGHLKILMATLANLGVLLLLMLTALRSSGRRPAASDRLARGRRRKSVPYVFSLIALLTGLATAMYKRWQKTHLAGSFLGSATVLLLLNIAAARWFAGGSYVLVWPLLAVLLAAVFAAFNRQRTSLPHDDSALPARAASLVIFVPLLRGFYEGLGLSSFVPFWLWRSDFSCSGSCLCSRHF